MEANQETPAVEQAPAPQPETPAVEQAPATPAEPQFAIKDAQEVIFFDTQAAFDVYILANAAAIRTDPARLQAAQSLAGGRL